MQTGAMDRAVLAFIALSPAAQPAQAAALDGAALSCPWALPFVGLLMKIATGPLLFPKIWHDHCGKIAALWSALALANIFASANKLAVAQLGARRGFGMSASPPSAEIRSRRSHFRVVPMH
jgi:hypothetical protein